MIYHSICKKCTSCENYIKDACEGLLEYNRYDCPKWHAGRERDLDMGDQRAKADAGKAKISLVPPQIIMDIAEVREYGNRKYGDPDNWKTVEAERYIDALGRHFLAMLADPLSKDPESGIEHYKHCACNLAFLCEMLKDKAGEAEDVPRVFCRKKRSDNMENLKKETLKFLADNDLTIDDIKWVGCCDFKIPMENFLELADKEYDSGFGAQEVAKDLILVGGDFWIEREEYDGSEWWALKRYPKEPATIHTVHDLYGMWDYLEQFINK